MDSLYVVVNNETNEGEGMSISLDVAVSFLETINLGFEKPMYRLKKITTKKIIENLVLSHSYLILSNVNRNVYVPNYYYNHITAYAYTTYTDLVSLYNNIGSVIDKFDFTDKDKKKVEKAQDVILCKADKKHVLESVYRDVHDLCYTPCKLHLTLKSYCELENIEKPYIIL